jgi:AcrR family transcriptional regulator
MNERSFNLREARVLTKRDRKKEAIIAQRRGQIMDAAMAVFSREGYDGATIANVAAEAGVAVGTVYNYFPSKRELLVEIAENYVIAPFRQIVENRPGNDLEFLAAIMENRLSLGLDDISRFLALVNEVQRDPALRQRYADQALGPVLNKLEDYIRMRIKDGTFRELDPALIVRAVGGMYIGFLLIVQMEGDKTPVNTGNRQRLAREMANLVLEGVRRR